MRVDVPLEAMLAPLFEIRVADAIDIAVVTLLLYAIVVWFRASRASMVAAGILVFTGLYGLARAFGLQLTTWVFQGVFTALLLIVVVIFQEELRQLFEQLALLGLRRRAPTGPSPRTTDLLVECLADMARRRVGALIVLPGRQPLGRHVRGGIELGGRVSLPLLLSLFDPHSPGHDGAVLLQGDRVTRFGVHLPLSTNPQQLAGLGTRHSAALGLAERTDALCLVVSEERGRVSVAQRGALRALSEPGEVARILEAFRERPASSRGPRLWRRMRRIRWPELAGCLAVVLGLWLMLVPGGRPSETVVDAPIELTNLPEGYDVETIEPPAVQVALRGPARTFYLLDPKSVGVVVDATLAQLGRRTFRLTPEQVRAPAGVDVMQIDPAQIRLSLRRKPGDGG